MFHVGNSQISKLGFLISTKFTTLIRVSYSHFIFSHHLSGFRALLIADLFALIDNRYLYAGQHNPQYYMLLIYYAYQSALTVDGYGVDAATGSLEEPWLILSLMMLTSM